ncbi:MAG: site-specific integrase [Alphaproteobacteria bacterium]
MKLTKRIVDAATPAADGRQLILWDGDVKGFGLRVTPAGVKSYILNYRIDGRERRYTIGKHGSPWTCEEARTRAIEALREIATGNDPLEAKRAEREAPTMTDLAARFLAEHADSKRKVSTAKEYRRLFDKKILPVLGVRKVVDIRRADIVRLHHDLRDTPYLANRTLALLSKAFSLAETWGLLPDNSNPCRRIEKFPEQKRDRFLSGDELARLGDALATYEGSPYVVALVKLLILTGARLNEIQTLEWSMVDFERQEVRLTHHKTDRTTGAKTLHLPPPAMTVLVELPRVEGNPFVIVGERRGRHLVNAQKPWRAIREAAGLPGLRLHDLRHSFASVGASAGMGLPIIGKLLGHTQPQTTARYAHLESDPVKAAAASVAGKIAAAMDGSKADVVTLPKGGRKG